LIIPDWFLTTQDWSEEHQSGHCLDPEDWSQLYLQQDLPCEQRAGEKVSRVTSKDKGNMVLLFTLHFHDFQYIILLILLLVYSSELSSMDFLIRFIFGFAGFPEPGWQQTG